jgi:hypothetical protein
VAECEVEDDNEEVEGGDAEVGNLRVSGGIETRGGRGAR